MKPIYKALVALISVIVILSSAAYSSRLPNKESPGESKNQGVSTRNKKVEVVNKRTGLPTFIHNIITPGL
jgi:hypothetical protein